MSILPSKVKQARERIAGTGFMKFMGRIFKEFSQDDGSTMAAGVAYYVFLSLFPLLLGLIAVLGLILPSRAVQEQIFTFLGENIPGSGEVIQNNIQSVINLRGTLGIIGIIGLLWTGSGALAAIAHSINQAWDIHKEMQFILKKLRDIFLSLGLGLLFFLSIGTSAVASVIANFAPLQDIPVVGSLFGQILLRVVASLFSFAIFLVLFKVIPNTKTYWRHVWFGALVTTVLFEIGRGLAFFYLTNFTDYEMVYGSIASVIVLLVWIYYSAIIVVLGAELTAEYGRMRRGIGRGFPSHSIVRPGKA